MKRSLRHKLSSSYTESGNHSAECCRSLENHSLPSALAQTDPESSGGCEEAPSPAAHHGLSALLCRTCSCLQVSALRTITTQPHLLIPVRMQHKGRPDYLCTDGLAGWDPHHTKHFSVSKSVKLDRCEWMQKLRTMVMGFIPTWSGTDLNNVWG